MKTYPSGRAAVGIALIVVVAGAVLYGLTAMNRGPFGVGTPPSASVTGTTCAQAGYGGTLAGSFSVRAADLAQQDESRGGANGPHPLRSSFRDYPADAPILLCFFDGFIAAPGGPPPIPPATFRPYDRFVVTVDPSGHATLAVAGHRDTIAGRPQLP